MQNHSGKCGQERAKYRLGKHRLTKLIQRIVEARYFLQAKKGGHRL